MQKMWNLSVRDPELRPHPKEDVTLQSLGIKAREGEQTLYMQEVLDSLKRIECIHNITNGLWRDERGAGEATRMGAGASENNVGLNITM